MATSTAARRGIVLAAAASIALLAGCAQAGELAAAPTASETPAESQAPAPVPTTTASATPTAAPAPAPAPTASARPPALVTPPPGATPVPDAGPQDQPPRSVEIDGQRYTLEASSLGGVTLPMPEGWTADRRQYDDGEGVLDVLTLIDGRGDPVIAHLDGPRAAFFNVSTQSTWVEGETRPVADGLEVASWSYEFEYMPPDLSLQQGVGLRAVGQDALPDVPICDEAGLCRQLSGSFPDWYTDLRTPEAWFASDLHEQMMTIVEHAQLHDIQR